MLKKLGRRVLLPLLFSFCCVFSGFLSVKTFAYTSYDYFPIDTGLKIHIVRVTNGNNVSLYEETVKYGDSFVYDYKNPLCSDVDYITFLNDVNYVPFSFTYQPTVFDYYFVGSVSGWGTDISRFTSFPTGLAIYGTNHSGYNENYILSDVNFYHLDVDNFKGFSVSAKIDSTNNVGIEGIYFPLSRGTVAGTLKAEFSIVALPKGTGQGDANQAIVNAINNQTNQLSSDIGQAADDVQQSIEDQYSGEPEDEFNIDDVVTEHTEKMGVLSFGSDVMVQFLDMFQSANAGTAELTLPGFNITVQNVEYQVWPDYSFNFNQIDSWVPGLMSIVRVILPAFVWLKVLGYCITVFEKNFLSNNGG